MTTLTQAQFARHLGIDRAHVTRLKQAGRLVMTDDGKLVDVEASEARIAATADPAKAPVAARHAVARAAAVDGQQPLKTVPDDDSTLAAGAPDYQRARARREEANACLAEIELACTLGKLMEASGVVAAIADAGTTLRSMLETLPAVLAPQLATLSDDHARQNLLEEHVGAAINELIDRLTGIHKHQ